MLTQEKNPRIGSDDPQARKTGQVNLESFKFKKTETIIITVGVLLFLGAGFFSLFFDAIPNIIISLCFGLSVTCLIYRFLGGLSNSSLPLMGGKLVGSAAFLYAIVWFINSKLSDQRPVIAPSPDTWVAMNQSGAIIPVNIGGKNHTQDPAHFWGQAEWSVINEDSAIWISNSANRLAQLAPKSLNEIGYFDWIGMKEGIQYTDKLTAGSTENLSPIFPLIIKATAFRDEYNAFDLLDTDGMIIDQGTLRTRNFTMVKHGGKYYIIFVRGAVHNDLDNEPWASFGVMEFIPTTRQLKLTD